MPYRLNPKNKKQVQVKRGGKWEPKSTCESEAAAQRQLNLLRGVEHSDWKPTGKKATKRKKRRKRK